MRKIFVLLVFLVLIYSVPLYSQTEQGHLFTMTMITMPSDQLSEFLKFYETEGKPGDAQNEHILSLKIFTHAWGPEWKVCIVAEYKNWEGFLASDKRYNEISEKMYPDKTKRDEMGKKWGAFLDHHTDAIVMDNPKLQK